MQTVVVTGATGTIGKEIVTALAARADVRVLAGGGISGWFGYCRAGRAARTTTDAERILGKRPSSVREFAQDHADLLR